MKKSILIVLSILLCFCLAACAEQKTPVSGQSSQQEQSDIQNSTDSLDNQSANSQEPESSSSIAETPRTGERKLKLTINGDEFDVTLYDTPAANALYDMLPLELTFEEFNGVEKIAYMDSKLPTEGEPEAFDPGVGDLCLYAPWGNLSIFYKDFRNSNGLISLGHIDSGMEIIASMNEEFSVTLSKL